MLEDVESIEWDVDQEGHEQDIEMTELLVIEEGLHHHSTSNGRDHYLGADENGCLSDGMSSERPSSPHTELKSELNSGSTPSSELPSSPSKESLSNTMSRALRYLNVLVLSVCMISSLLRPMEERIERRLQPSSKRRLPMGIEFGNSFSIIMDRFLADNNYYYGNDDDQVGGGDDVYAYLNSSNYTYYNISDANNTYYEEEQEDQYYYEPPIGEDFKCT